MKKLVATALLGATFALNLGVAQAETITVAVAANFTKAITEIGQEWTKKTGNEVRFSFGATGGLYAQINNGAPFDAFFSADTKTPKKLVDEGKATDYFEYAQGKLALFSTRLPVAKDAEAVIKGDQYTHIAIANPKGAPYGTAAVEVLKKMGMYDKLNEQKKIAQGESITATFQFVLTDNAQLGFVALSQIMDPESPAKGKGEYWVVPQADYTPINQAAVLIKNSKHEAAAKSFLNFMHSPEAIAVIKRYGYELPK
ncbi:molybdate ABC transporter substrate-binding protein [Halothiobacillus sp. DCM-1]|uniref:molybdate ABC transporter substrate-binding protein n=1 Tax=Halothiobacillus sp. DCM-1 TaxID=3112558 RepID=UPI00324AE378